MMKQNDLTWIFTYLSDVELKSIRDAVMKAEKNTSVEIVPMVVRGSSTVGHVPVIVFLIGMVFLLSFESNLQMSWWPWSFWISWVLQVVLLVFVSLFVSRLFFIQRLFTTKVDLLRQVEWRAQLEFYQNSVHVTKGSTGILIFVSLMERMVVVLADKAIAEKLPPDTWRDLVTNFTEKLKSNKLGLGFVESIDQCSVLVTSLFPAGEQNPNEIADGLIIKE